MKYYVVLLLLLSLLIPQAAQSSMSTAWFTDGPISMASKLSIPSNAPPADPNGTKGSGVDLTNFSGVTFAVPELSKTSKGIISFWLRPIEDGLLAEGGGEHILMMAGDPQINGLQVSWDNSKGFLRFKMAGKNGTNTKVTVCRADISSWKAHDWHHVQIAWLDLYGTGVPVGLAIWIDKIAVSSCIFGGTKYLDPPASNNITLGDSSSKCYMDELVFHNSLVELDTGAYHSATTWAHRFFTQTGPYTEIQITHTPNLVNSDTWVLAGKQKQFGVTGTRLLNAATGATTTEYLTNHEADFSGSHVTWTLSDTSYASVDNNGLVTGKIPTTTPVTLSTTYAGLSADYPLHVKSWDAKPDLCLEFVERTPRYNMFDEKIWPDPGDIVTSIAHIGNFGTATASNFKVKIEKATDANNNFVVDPDETWTTLCETMITSLAEGEETTVSQDWTWPENGLTTGSVFIRVTIDSDGTLDEICEANNQRCEKSNAQAMYWGRPTITTGDCNSFEDDYNNRVINLVGSFSDYDWCNAETDRVAMMLREAILPTTTPDGILDSIRVDMYYDLEDDIEQHIDYYDGYWTHMEPYNVGNMDYDSAIGHEIGHTVLGLPDLYGQCSSTDDMFLKDPNGNPYAATPIYPITRGYGNQAMYSSATFDHVDECGAGEPTLMDACSLWLDRMCAGLIQFHRQQRKGLYEYWGDFGEWIPTTNTLQFSDIDDAPLANARVYVYQMINTEEWYTYGNRYYPDRPKFIGETDISGRWTIPTSTCEYWDDWCTGEVEGIVPVSTPFATVNGKTFTCPSGATGEVLLLKVVGENDQVEFHLLPLTEFNDAYFSGNTDTATYPVQTSLTSPASTPEILPPSVPAGGEPPVACVKYNNELHYCDFDIFVAPGSSITFDGSVSYDPEGQPLIYRWDGSWDKSTESTYTIPIGGTGDYDVRMGVYDSVCFSGRLTIYVHVKDGGYVTGQVTESTGNPIEGAIVGIKPESIATADADYYAVTDSNGYYTTQAVDMGDYYLAAWKDGWIPTVDQSVAMTGGEETLNFVLSEKAGVNHSLDCWTWATSKENDESDSSNAVDGSMETPWASEWFELPQSLIIDFSQKYEVDINSVIINWFWDRRAGSYTIDVMPETDPRILSNWDDPNNYETVYSTYGTKGGWANNDMEYYNTWYDPIRLTNIARARGLRVHIIDSTEWPPCYGINELQIYGSPIVPIIDTIAQAKAITNGSYIGLEGKQITALPGGGIPADTVYIEEIDRSNGIRLDLSMLTEPNVELNDLVNAKGMVGTTSDGEMCIKVIEINPAYSDELIWPLGMNNRAVGGSTFHGQIGSWDWRWIKNFSGEWEYKFLELVGQNNIGTLITVCGRVTQVDPSGNYFYIDDGANLDDGTDTDGTKNVGLRVTLGNKIYDEGQFLVITGISSCFKHTDGKLRRLLRVRGESDVQQISDQ